MRIPCVIDTFRRQKNCLKIVFTIDDKDSEDFLKNINGFMKMPLTIEILTDLPKQIEIMNQITPDQRKKIYAIIKDIAEYSGEDTESQKQTMKLAYCGVREIEIFSLSDCKAEVAGDFINWLIEFCFEHDVPLSENPTTGNSDIEAIIRMCIKKQKCCVCSEAGKAYSMKDGKQIPLCDIHKTKMVNDGKDKFCETFHVMAV